MNLRTYLMIKSAEDASSTEPGWGKRLWGKMKQHNRGLSMLGGAAAGGALGELLDDDYGGVLGAIGGGALGNYLAAARDLKDGESVLWGNKRAPGGQGTAGEYSRLNRLLGKLWQKLKMR